ncbi:EAL domain-containing protein [Colwellia sp. UCD-KL20]|uniref:putative bifunctional diguanylate cyclase/phosphodiesterase n=1 Tax=Colwellia sp. UCD-KL20 TaxID=1917165 RepID=UPI0009710D4A|nr:EAL domain-containing protein [Colwellia sp. UCD-KL20]
MIFQSVKSTLATLTISIIIIVSFSVLVVSIFEHENLYQKFVKSDLDGLSENITNDLVPLIGDTRDVFYITTVLLRLDHYENVKFAAVLTPEFKPIETYIGKANIPSEDIDYYFTKYDLNKTPFGISTNKEELISFKYIGDKHLPIGYLLIINDYQGPLDRSKLSLLKQALPIILVVLAIMILFSLWLHNKLLSPLTRLSLLAKKIENTKDYSLRVNVEGKTEVASLSHNVNSMMQAINKETQINAEYTLQLKEQRLEMEKLANYDSLTGLSNRQHFMQKVKKELEDAEREGNNLFLIYIDLDGFKAVNDTYGHDAGDKLLIEVKNRLQKIVAKESFISRLSGDEFLVLMDRKTSYLSVEKIAGEIVKELNAAFLIDGWKVHIGASCGIASAVDAEFDLGDFVHHADIAMYSSKELGRGRYTFFTQEMKDNNKRELLIANSIMSAINNNEFELYYQCKMSPDEKIVGFEALIRWHKGVLGTVPPDEFISIAEQSGKIIPITHWVLEQLCKDLPKIYQLFDMNTVVSVNLSAHDIRSDGLLEFIQQLFIQYNVLPRCIEFEVTESAYLENFAQANAFFTQITNMGASVALDDFGTGYSSLSYLTKIPINTLKIDKQFIDDVGVSEDATTITKTIIEMAKQLNLRVCCEGVETQLQADFLIEQGCYQLQGYLYSKPLSLDNLGDLLSLECNSLEKV